MNIHVGDEIELTEQVVPENTAKEWGSGSLPVYATPAMILLIEKAAVKLSEIDRKRLVFHIEVTDNKGRVGIGTHERFIVADEPFMEKAAKKLED